MQTLYIPKDPEEAVELAFKRACSTMICLERCANPRNKFNPLYDAYQYRYKKFVERFNESLLLLHGDMPKNYITSPDEAIKDMSVGELGNVNRRILFVRNQFAHAVIGEVNAHIAWMRDDIKHGDKILQESDLNI